MCWTSAVEVGGIFSRDRPFGVNMVFLASFTSSLALVRSYISITNRWLVGMAFESLSAVGVLLRDLNTSVPSWYAIQVFQAVFFLLPANVDVWSHPVNAWKTREPRNSLVQEMQQSHGWQCSILSTKSNPELLQVPSTEKCNSKHHNVGVYGSQPPFL